MKGLMKGAAIAAVALALGTGAAQAQIAQFGVGGGVSIPTGDAGDALNTGFHGGAHVRLSPPALPVAFQIDGLFQRFGTDADDVNFQSLSVTGDVVWTLPSAPATPVKPYLLGGVGLYNYKFTGDGVPAGFDESTTDFGINVGAGFNFGKKLFAEARFHRVFTDGDSDLNIIPITVGLRF